MLIFYKFYIIIKLLMKFSTVGDLHFTEND